MNANARQRRAARHLPPPPEVRAGADGADPEADSEAGPRVGADGAGPPPRRRPDPITPARVVDTALELIAAEGYEALTMRRLAAALNTGPASLYAHVVNKADLDELLIARLCAELALPEPDPATWPEQIRDVCTQLRERYLSYPGISRAALAMASTDLQTLRVGEGMLAVLLAGDVAPRDAAWAVDALLLYVAAYCLEAAIALQRSAQQSAQPDGTWVVDRDDLRRRLAALPAETFPHTNRHAAELTAGQGHDRFDFTLTLMIDGLRRR